MAAELMPGQKRFTPASIAADGLLLLWFVFSLFPIVWMILLSLKTPAEQTTTYFRFSPTLENFGIVLSDRGTELTSVNYPSAILSSVVNCGGAVLVSLLIGIPAATPRAATASGVPTTSCSRSCRSGSPRS
jgi:multiple sugar transport system permease protein